MSARRLLAEVGVGTGTRSRTVMEYRGYRGVVVFDDEVGLLHGEVVDTRDVITFQGGLVSEVRKAFEDSVSEYLAICSERGWPPIAEVAVPSG